MNETLFLASRHDPWIVLASVVIATLASYVALDLSLRVRSPGGKVNRVWWLAGSLVMGTGIWSMHFVGMLAFSLPIQLGFNGLMTLLSWIAALMACAIALWAASAERFGARPIALASLAMGSGICGMHYLGMAAMELTIPIAWNLPVVVLSVAIAVAASAAALVIFRLLVQVRAERRFAAQLAAAAVMGAAICGMHYTGMAAARFPAGTVCVSADALGGRGLTVILVVATCMLLLGTLLASILEARLQLVARRLAGSLQEANARLKTANEELTQRAFSDPLTGLPNRHLFEDRLARAARRRGPPGASEAEHMLAVLFIDLDGFKPVNDSFGHAAGDEVLRASAGRLMLSAREDDTVARIGGDEFLVLLDGHADAAECARVAQRMLDAIAAPFEVAERTVRIACSIGIARLDPGADAGRLIANADAAMYAAKRAGGSTFSFFEDHMVVDTSEQLSLLGDLRRALELQQFELYYQPKIDARRQRISGVEALLRWNHPRLGVVDPADFMAAAERGGLLASLGRWMLEEACRQAAAWRAQGRELRVAVQFSAPQLGDGSLVANVAEALRRHGLPASQLLCEITESAAMQDVKATMRVFEGLLALGVQLSIDEFGSACSSLNQLKELPARQLKIDRRFVHELEHAQDARALVESIIRLAHGLQLTVVAEGVETAGQRDILVKMGCDELQGFLYARPMQASAMQSWSLEAPEPRSRTFAPRPSHDAAQASA